MASKLLEFCPVCQSLMTAQSDEEFKLSLACKNCGHTAESDGATKILKSTRMTHELNRERLNASMIYDTALRKSARIACPTVSCPSRDARNWGSRVPDTGIVIQPAVAITNFTSRDRVAEYICLACRSTFKVGSGERESHPS